MLNVIMLSVVVLSVMAPQALTAKIRPKKAFKGFLVFYWLLVGFIWLYLALVGLQLYFS
jgi:hypothetical protein